eukprot:c19609_g1_i1.p1 GENE.c19609_g1_i1~~c19609_g1_i1.p1  ORF type:complete len:483 (-),score=109.84 c19609_g1_i1:92-1540(-)
MGIRHLSETMSHLAVYLAARREKLAEDLGVPGVDEKRAILNFKAAVLRATQEFEATGDITLTEEGWVWMDDGDILKARRAGPLQRKTEVEAQEEEPTAEEVKAQELSVIRAAFDRDPVVIDSGSGFIKAGFAGAPTPKAIFPSIIGRPKHLEVMIDSMMSSDVCVGATALSRRGMLSLSYPVSEGVVKDWDSMELLWQHTFYDVLRCCPEDQPLLMTEPPLNPLRNRERMAQIMFESFAIPAAFVAIQAVLALYASGKTTGAVLDIGDGVAHSVPVYEGYSMPHAIKRMNLAGRHLTQHLLTLLRARGRAFTTTAEFEIAREIKQSLCYVALDYEAESQKTVEVKRYTLPDGQSVVLGNERFECPEVLFQPNLLGKDVPGVSTQLYQTIMACDIDARADLFSNIVISGGTTTLPGFKERLQKDLKGLAPGRARVRVEAPEDPAIAVWVGGSILAKLSTFEALCVTKAEYDEVGPSIIHKKCF